MDEENENRSIILDSNTTKEEIKNALNQKLEEAMYGTLFVLLVKDIDTTISFHEIDPVFAFTVLQFFNKKEIDVWLGSIYGENICRDAAVSKASEAIYKYVQIIKNGALVNCGITECCGYDFGEDAFEKNKPKFCPMCGKKITKYK
jgi:hypothetical protein